MVLSMSVPVLFAGTMSLHKLVEMQANFRWFGLIMPTAFLIYLISALAENERTPFDLLEAESEIVAGYHIEYSGLKFAWFFLAFFLNTLLLSAIAVTLFLGGWQGPFVDKVPLLGVLYFFLKTVLIVFVFMWVRATFPRLRIDQMMALAWKVLVPMALALVLLAATAVKLPWPPLARDVFLFFSNIVMLFVALGAIGRHLRQEAERFSGRQKWATSSSTTS